MITLTEARYVDGYRIEIRFSDGMGGTVDFADIIPKFPAAVSASNQFDGSLFKQDDGRCEGPSGERPLGFATWPAAITTSLCSPRFCLSRWMF